MQGPDEIEQLVQRAQALLACAQSLASENAQLREALNASEQRERSLAKRLAAARARVDALIVRLPDERQIAQGSLIPPGGAA